VSIRIERQALAAAWDEIAPQYAARRDPTGSDAALIEELIELLPQDALVLDVGCGDGARTLANLPAGSVGLDISQVALSLATAAVPTARLVRGDLAAVPVAGGVADAITAYHAVFHVPRTEHPAVFAEFARVIRPEGWLLMTLPSAPVDTIREGWMGGRMRFSTFGREATLDAVAEAGFRIARTPVVTDPLGSTTEMLLAKRGPH